MAKLRRRPTRPQTADCVELVCDCGETLRGERGTQYEILECAACGGGLFLLPRSRYPRVKPERAADAAAKPRPRSMPKPRRNVEAADDKIDQTALSLETRQRLITPARLVIVLGLIAVAATGYWLHRRRVRNTAEREFVQHGEAGRDALKQGDHAAAKREFEQAVLAADLLQRDDEEARHARQMFRECTAIVDLSSESLFGILQQADAAANEDWPKTFKREFADKWLILDTTLRDQPGGGVAIEYPLKINSRPVVLRGDLSVYEKISFESIGYRRVVLAVQLKSCAISAEGNWVVEFEPASAFLWSNFDNLLAIGFAVAPENRAKARGEIDTATELKQLLRGQSQLMGLME